MVRPINIGAGFFQRIGNIGDVSRFFRERVHFVLVRRIQFLAAARSVRRVQFGFVVCLVNVFADRRVDGFSEGRVVVVLFECSVRRGLQATVRRSERQIEIGRYFRAEQFVDFLRGYDRARAGGFHAVRIGVRVEVRRRRQDVLHGIVRFRNRYDRLIWHIFGTRVD